MRSEHLLNEGHVAEENLQHWKPLPVQKVTNEKQMGGWEAGSMGGWEAGRQNRVGEF
jgi:hypothetical protein